MGVFDKIYDLLEVCDYTRLYAVIYAYICSMVKDRLRVMNRYKYMRDRARSSTACGYGASVPLTVRYRLEKKNKKPITKRYRLYKFL